MQDKIKSTFEKVLSLPRWKIYSSVTLKVEDKPLSPIEAKISCESWDIYLDAASNIDELCKATINKYKLNAHYQTPLDPLETLIFSSILHEESHWNVCPFDKQFFEDILSGCYDGLQAKSFPSIKTANLDSRNYLILSWISCMRTFEDLIVNTYVSNMDKDSDEYKKGMALFQLIYSGLSQENLTKFDTIFRDLNTKLSDYNPDFCNALSGSYNKEYPSLKGPINKIIGIFTEDDNLTEKIINHNLKPEEKKYLARSAADPRNNSWYKKSKEYTKIMAEYIRDEYDKIMQNSQGSEFIQKFFGQAMEIEAPNYNKMKSDSKDGQNNGSDSDDEDNNEKSEKDSKKNSGKGKPGKKDKKDESDSKAGKGEKGQKSQEDKKKESGNKKKPDLYDKIDKNFLEEMIGIGLDKGNKINYSDDFHLLDVLYKQRAEQIVVNLIQEKDDALTTRIADLTREIVTPDNLDLKRVQWSRTRIYHKNEGKRIDLYRGEEPLDLDDPAIPSKKNIPDIALIIDSSGSMEADLFRGDERPYDLLLRAQYSLFNWLEKTGKGYHMNFAVVNFSGDTYFSGWKPYYLLNEVKEALFEFQNGGTVLNPKEIEKLYTQRKDPFLAIMTTDGGLGNPEEASEELKKLVSYGNELAVIHIAGNSSYFSDQDKEFLDSLKSCAQIHKINDAHDLIGIEIGYAEKYWGKVYR